MTETVSYAGSGLVFVNTYGAQVSAAYRDAILKAEQFLQQHFKDAVTLSINFDYYDIGQSYVAQNEFSTFHVSYAGLVSALTARATTGNDRLAAAGLPGGDPTGGVGFDIAQSQARMLGLAGATGDFDLTVTLNSTYGFTFGQDAVSALIHEITEGGFGRIGGLGADGSWGPMDLFRFTRSGQRDYTGGRDGQTTYFGVDASHVGNFAYHNPWNTRGVSDGFDSADWDSLYGDAFGPALRGVTSTVSTTDLITLDILGWTPTTNFWEPPQYSTDWSVAANWYFGSPPTAADDVSLPATAGYYTTNVFISASTAATARSLTVAAGAALSVAGSLTLGTPLTLNGSTLSLNGGTLTAPSVNAAGASTLQGYGVIRGSLTGPFNLNVTGSMVLDGAVAGPVSIVLNADGKLELTTGASGGVIAFSSPVFGHGSTLVIDRPESFWLNMTGYTAQSVLDIRGFTPVSIRYDGSGLDLTDAANRSLHFQLSGTVSGYTAGAVSDGAGGSIITWLPNAPEHLAIGDANPWEGASLPQPGTRAVNGTAPAWATVTLYDNGRMIGGGGADGAGRFNINIGAPSIGQHIYTAVASSGTGQSSAASAPFTFRAGHSQSGNDFNADGHSDLLWRNAASGVFSTWQVLGSPIAGQLLVNAYVNDSVSPDWQIQGSLDFNGDNAADIVWRNIRSGALTVWSSTRVGFTTNAYSDTSFGTDWSVTGFGDFNGDGREDILWRRADGALAESRSTGSGFFPAYLSTSSVDPSWRIVGIGDFNGDGAADLLWRNVGGNFTIWSATKGDYFNPPGFRENTYEDSSVSTAWHIAAVGDFDGDGKDDLLWRNDNGTFTEWRSTGSGFKANVYIDDSVATGWKVQGVFDFNADGKADILWRNDSGTVTVWQSTGDGFTPNTLVENSVPNTWQLMTHHYDFV